MEDQRSTDALALHMEAWMLQHRRAPPPLADPSWGVWGGPPLSMQLTLDMEDQVTSAMGRSDVRDQEAIGWTEAIFAVSHILDLDLADVASRWSSQSNLNGIIHWNIQGVMVRVMQIDITHMGLYDGRHRRCSDWCTFPPDPHGSDTLRYFGCADLEGLLRCGGRIRASTGDRTLLGLGEVFFHCNENQLHIALKYGKPTLLGKQRFRVVCQFDNLCWRSCHAKREWRCSRHACSRYTLTAICLVPEADCAHMEGFWV